MIMKAMVMPRATSSERSRLIGVGAAAETVIRPGISVRPNANGCPYLTRSGRGRKVGIGAQNPGVLLEEPMTGFTKFYHCLGNLRSAHGQSFFSLLNLHEWGQARYWGDPLRILGKSHRQMPGQWLAHH